MSSLTIVVNVMKRLLREKSTLIFILILPVLAGTLVTVLTAKPAPISIGVSEVQGAAELVEFLEAQGKYEIKLMNTTAIEAAVKQGDIPMGILIPQAYDAEAPLSNTNKIKLVALKQNGTQAELHGYLELYAAYSSGALEELPALAGQTDTMPSGRMALGFLTMFMILLCGIGMRMILEDKRNKTYMRSFCAPLRASEWVSGHLAANTLLGLVQILVFIFITSFFLKVDWGIPFSQLMLILSVYMIAVIGLCICLLSFISSDKIYNAVNSQVATITCMLGGSFIPLSMLPEPFQKAANMLPQKWVMEAYERLSTGASLQEVSLHIMILLLFGAAFFTFGMKTLRLEEGDL